MNLEGLRIFLALADGAALDVVAQAFGLNLAGVERSIAELSRSTRVELMDSDCRPTTAGRAFVHHARTIVDAIDAAKADIATLDATIAGKFSLGLAHAAIYEVLPRFVDAFQERFPHVQIEVVEGFSGAIIEWLATGRIDVGILYNAPKTSYLLVEPLRDEALYLCCPPGARDTMPEGPVPISELSRFPLIMPSRRTMLSDSDFSQHARDFSVVLEIDTLELILELVEAGIGYSLLPAFTCDELVAAGRIWRRPIEGSLLTRNLMLATSTQRRMTDVTREAANLLRKLLRGTKGASELVNATHDTTA